MNRRAFLLKTTAGVVGVSIDPEALERLLWVPDRKKIFIPPADFDVSDATWPGVGFRRGFFLYVET